jgi:hypothetical protein
MGKPVLAVVAIAQQRITVYDADGNSLVAPISSGATNYETPPGVFSVVQKEEDHRSNVYDDAEMPFMQRLTWTGIALHAGVLPGVPASHGCVRMPLAFAQHLYGKTDIGMRVVIVREDIAPTFIAQPFLFDRQAARSAAVGTSAVPVSVTRPDPLSPDAQIMELQSRARAALRERDEAVKRQRDARLALTKRSADVPAAKRGLAVAEAAVQKAEAALAASAKALEAVQASKLPEPKEGAEPDQKAIAAREQAIARAEAAKTDAQTKLAQAKTQVETAKADVQAKSEALDRAQAEVRAAEAAFNRAWEAAERTKLDISPVSVFISRKTQRLYIRKGMVPVYEGPITIKDPDRPIGSYVFTALRTGASDSLKWKVVSLYKQAEVQPHAEWKQAWLKAKRIEPLPADVAGAEAALARLGVPDNVLAKVSETVLPGASLIISDEAFMSTETGKDTDFVVVMSGEPQGGLVIREKSKSERRRSRDEDDYYFGRSRNFWSSYDDERPRRRGGGFFLFE